jgi:hypothetical protein
VLSSLRGCSVEIGQRVRERARLPRSHFSRGFVSHTIARPLVPQVRQVGRQGLNGQFAAANYVLSWIKDARSWVNPGRDSLNSAVCTADLSFPGLFQFRVSEEGSDVEGLLAMIGHFAE